MHGTLKDRLKPMRGLKAFDSTKAILAGYAVHYNYMRQHQSLKGKTPATVGGIQSLSNWKELIARAAQNEVQPRIELMPIAIMVTR